MAKAKLSFIISKMKDLFYIKKNDLIFLFCLSLFCAFLDLFTKSLMFSNTKSYIYINDLLNFIKVRNYGISFGLFDDRKTGMKIFIILFDIAVIIYLLTLVKTKENYKKPLYLLVSIGFIIGGAIGNMVDRIMYGSVRDFIDCHIKNHHWATFNVADMFVCCGVGIWILCELFYRENNKNIVTKSFKTIKKKK